MEKPDSAILFPGKEVCGLFIRPWKLPQLCSLAPTIDVIFGMARKEGVGEILWKFMNQIEEPDAGAKKLLEKVTYEVAAALTCMLPKALPHAPKIIAATITLPLFDDDGGVIGINPEGMKKTHDLDIVQTKEVMLEILVQNWDYIKNSSGPVRPAVKIAS